MISHIEIKDFAIIRDLSLDLYPGLNIITGETGSGKSVIIEAVSMALGARADTDYVRTGSEKAVVTVVADAGGKDISGVLEEIGAPEDVPVVIRREIYAAGRSLCRVNGAVVPLSALSKLCGYIADIHGQYDNQTLLDPDRHLGILDMYGGEELIRVRDMVSDSYRRFAADSAELAELNKKAAERERQKDLYAYELSEIENANLSENEDEELSRRIDLMKNSGKIYGALSEVHQMLFDGDQAAVSVLGHCMSDLSALSSYSEELSQLYERISGAYYDLDDASSQIRSLRDSADFSPEELESAEDRLDALNALKRKYGGSLEAVLEYAEKARKELSLIEGSGDRRTRLERAITLEKEEYDAAAARLSRLRKDTAEVLKKRIDKELLDLNFEAADFEVSMRPGRMSEDGTDNVEFLISANRGEEPKPLAKVASGGELSRIMLALKRITGDIGGVPSMIFDEIDSGISGKTAGVVGDKLRSLSEDHQIICITHLPQIAAKGDRNYRIEKHADLISTQTTVVPLTEDERVEEIARLLSASEITEAARMAAKELLKK
ncbi:MAG: DNA repair protein RecN [Clostridia bacterium]|nr:DNA repair protein RecN [Clostridia bacterium]